MKRGLVLLVALVVSGLANLFMLYVPLSLIFHVFVFTHPARWSDVLNWFGPAASIITVLAAISDNPITHHKRAIRVIGIIVVCLIIAVLIANRIYGIIEVRQFY